MAEAVMMPDAIVIVTMVTANFLIATLRARRIMTSISTTAPCGGITVAFPGRGCQASVVLPHRRASASVERSGETRIHG